MGLSPGLANAWKHKACTQANAFAVMTRGPDVSLYLPNGSWYEGTTGVRVVSLENGPANPVTIPTPGIVDACASDPTLQEVVCTATDSDVYLIKGTSLITTLQSSGSGTASFSGGNCTNCSLAINPITDIAYIEEAYASQPAVQALHLRHNNFTSPLVLQNGISESIQVDTVRNVLLSASEQSVYDVIKLDSAGDPATEFGNGSVDAEYDASGEDCLTGVAVGTDEFTGNLFLASLNSAVFDTTTSSWSDSQEVLQYFPEFDGLAAGTTGLAIAPGTHDAVLAGEFGGNLVGFIHLPNTGSISPTDLQRYVVATLPTDPNGYTFQNGYDPHSVTAYTSPNTQKTYAVLADWADGAPDYVALIDIEGVLDAPRVMSASGRKHAVSPDYGLKVHGLLKYIKRDLCADCCCRRAR
jgi:hypothetical protein